MYKEIENKIGQLQYEIRNLGLDKEELTGVSIRIEELKELVKSLLPIVGSSFFTSSDLGKEFEIIANTSGHGFYVGEIVTLLELNKDKDDYEFKFAGKDDYWWCNFADVKVK